MKRIIAAALILIMLIVPMTVAPASAESSNTPNRLNIVEDFSEGELNKSFSDAKLLCVEPEGYGMCTETLGALGAKNSMMLNYTSLRGYHNIGGNQGFRVIYTNPIDLKNAESLMYYVKMPLSRSGNEGDNWMKSGIAMMLFLGNGAYTSLSTDQEIKVLAKNSSKWETYKIVSGLYLDLPSGFEGYIKIDIDNFQKELPKDIREYDIEQSIFQFSNMGDHCGPAYINAVYTVTNESDSIYAQFNGDDALYNMSCNMDASTADTDLLPKAMKARILQSFDAYAAGYDMLGNGVASIQNKEDVSARTVDKRGGLDDSPSIEFSSNTVGSFYDVDPMYTFKYPHNTTLEDMKAILFYVECPKPYFEQPDLSKVRFNIMTNKDGTPKWTLLGNGRAMYLQDGTDSWKTAGEDSQGIVYLPAGFSGWIMVDIEQMLQNPIFDDLEDRIAVSSTFQFHGLGGDCGSGYIDAVYCITDKEDKDEYFITFDGHNVWDLSTGKRAVKRAESLKALEKDSEYSDIPETTLDLNVKVDSSEISSSQAIIRWDEYKGAERYRVDLYKIENANVGNAIAYICKNSKFIDSTAIYFEGLEASTRYYAVVTVFDKNGEELGVYNYGRFYTTAGNTVITQPDDVQTGTDSAEIPEASGLIKKELVPVAIGGVLILAAIAIAIVLLVGKRNKKEGT